MQLGPKYIVFFILVKTMRILIWFIDGWAIKSVKDVETCEDSRQDIVEGSIKISHLGSDKYLRQKIGAEGRKTSHREKMKKKAHSK